MKSARLVKAFTFVEIIVTLLLLSSPAAHSSSRSLDNDVEADGWCAGGFGANNRIRLTSDKINDGYCDCPLTGQDEPQTQACAGSATWAGMIGEERDAASGSSSPKPGSHAVTFTCPQQEDLILPFSRLNDGICDCCDGADETDAAMNVQCPDMCAELLLAKQQAKAAALQAYQAGSSKRQNQVLEFSQLQTQVEHDLKKKQADFYFHQQEQERLSQLIEKAVALQADHRWDLVKGKSLALADAAYVDNVDSKYRGWFDGLTAEELEWFIVHACQLSGEIVSFATVSSTRSKRKTCVPLRLAALDLATFWKDDSSYEFVANDKENAAWLLDEILAHPEIPVWNSKKTTSSPKRRRLDDILDEDDDVYLDEHDDYYYEDEEVPTPTPTRRQQDAEGEAKGGKREELIKFVQEKPFSFGRVAFYSQAEELLNQIKTLLDDNKKQNSNDNHEEEQETQNMEEPPAQEQIPAIDPMALNMVRGTLEQRQHAIQQGYDDAASAQVLLESVKAAITDSKQLQETLSLLAVGVIHHGRLSSIQYYEVLTAIVPELQAIFNDETSNGSETCASPWASICPPRFVERVGSGGYKVYLPPPEVYSHVKGSYCETHSSNTMLEDVCKAQAASTIPDNIPDGYYGYRVAEARADTDVFYPLFKDMTLQKTADAPLRAELVDLERDLEKVQGDIRDLESEMKKLKQSVDADKFGPDGELHAIKDECFSIEAGKYLYEVCMFGSASQKEPDQGGRGTDLGRWDKATVDENTGKRIWVWSRGAKCWNGPQRSATVHVSCGEDNQIISAEEPETCKYVFEMTSHIACDENFRIRNNL